jgi:hypothetical protein
MLPQVIFRARADDKIIRFYVAYLLRDSAGRCFAVLSEDQEGYGVESGPMLDPLLLEEQTDETSEEPFYLYRGVLDVRRSASNASRTSGESSKIGKTFLSIMSACSAKRLHFMIDHRSGIPFPARMTVFRS